MPCLCRVYLGRLLRLFGEYDTNIIEIHDGDEHIGFMF